MNFERGADMRLVADNRMYPAKNEPTLQENIAGQPRRSLIEWWNTVRNNNPGSTYVYFFRAGRSGDIKIGKADDPQKRRYDLQCGCSEPLRILAVAGGVSAHVEYLLHDRFSRIRVRKGGEWFRPTPHLVSFIWHISLGMTLSEKRAMGFSFDCSKNDYKERWRDFGPLVKPHPAVQDIKEILLEHQEGCSNYQAHIAAIVAADAIGDLHMDEEEEGEDGSKEIYGALSLVCAKYGYRIVPL